MSGGGVFREGLPPRPPPLESPPALPAASLSTRPRAPRAAPPPQRAAPVAAARQARPPRAAAARVPDPLRCRRAAGRGRRPRVGGAQAHRRCGEALLVSDGNGDAAWMGWVPQARGRGSAFALTSRCVPRSGPRAAFVAACTSGGAAGGPSFLKPSAAPRWRCVRRPLRASARGPRLGSCVFGGPSCRLRWGPSSDDADVSDHQFHPPASYTLLLVL